MRGRRASDSVTVAPRARAGGRVVRPGWGVQRAALRTTSLAMGRAVLRVAVLWSAVAVLLGARSTSAARHLNDHVHSGGRVISHTISLLDPSRELALQLAATIAADGSLSEAVSALDDGKHTALAAYGGPRVALSGSTGAQIPGAVRWTTLTPGGTAAAPSLSATGTLVIKGRSAIPGGNATVETHTDCESDNRQFLPLSFLV